MKRILWKEYFSRLGIFFMVGCTASPKFTSSGKSSENRLGQATFTGVASFYGKDFHGKKTSNGEIYNMYDLTAAHKTLPFDSRLRVTNLRNGKAVIVRINDRGPFVEGRILDLSLGAAKELKAVTDGVIPVRIDIVKLGIP